MSKVQFLSSEVYASAAVRDRNKTTGQSHIDIIAPSRVDIKPGQKYRLPVDFQVEISNDEFGLFQPIHSLADRHELVVLSTTLHPGHKGRPTLVLWNSGDSVLEVMAGEHVAQLIFLKAGQISYGAE